MKCLLFREKSWFEACSRAEKGTVSDVLKEKIAPRTHLARCGFKLFGSGITAYVNQLHEDTACALSTIFCYTVDKCVTPRKQNFCYHSNRNRDVLDEGVEQYLFWY